MIRVAITVNSLVAGGAETLILQLCRALPSEGVAPLVASLLGPGPLTALFERQGTPVVNLTEAGERPGPGALWKLFMALKRERIDIVHTHLVYAGILGKVVAAMAGLPVVVTRHYMADPRERSPLFRLEDALTTRLTAQVVALTKAMGDTLVRQGLAESKRICVHHNAVDLSPYESMPASGTRRTGADGCVVGTVGRMEAPKAQEVFLEAVARVREAHPSTRGVIIGQGSRREELEAVRRRLDLDDAVFFTGGLPPDEVPAWLRRFDVFALSSSWEALPMALVEAKACGCPVVATAVGGIPEVVRHGIDGILVPPRDPNAMADAIIGLFERPDVRRAFGRAARAHAFAHFDISRLARQTATMYRQVLQERGGR